MNRILVLSEDNDYFSDISEAIQSLDHIEINTFSHSLELINFFLTNFAQLVILDLDVLRGETFEMIQILRSLHTKTKIVLFLSSENMPICSEALTFGVLSYQIKPVSRERTLEIIRSTFQIEIPNF
ncbi:MAG: response regulator [bacterium]|nr:MAG: response regulator [bacterium]